MQSILFLMEKLGFDTKQFEAGMCFGCATMASQAFVLGRQAYDRYQIRLNRIESLVDQYTKLPPLKHAANSSNVDRLNLEEARLKEIIKNFPPPINYLNKGENEWVSMRAYLESIAIAQQPQFFNRKYKIFHNQFINNINPLHFNNIAELIQSQLAEERGGFSQVGNFSGIYNIKEMKTLLNSWEQFMKEEKKEQSRSTLIISNRIHTFMLGYDADDKSWVMDDSSTVTKYQSRFFWDNKINELAKDIFLHVPLVEAGKIIALSDSEEKIIISTMVCSTNLSHSKMAQLFADEKWKLLHEVTLEKAKFQNKIGDSWLNIAAQHGHVEVVKELITAGSDVNLSVDNMTPLFFAAQNGNSDIVKVLIEAKADITVSPFTGCTPLYIAAQNGYEVIVKDLINAGADINIVYTENGTTPLFIAADNNHPQCVKSLLEAKADTNIVSNAGATPLFIAAQDGYSDIVKDLINAGADITISPFKGVTPLYIAAQNRHVEIVKELITAGSDVNLSVNDITPLFFAAQNGNSDIVKVLIEAKADITVSPFTGCTPLYIAAQNGYEVIVKDLINAGADINISAEGNTPLCIAKQNGHIEVVKELEKAVTNIDKLFKESTSGKKITINTKKDSLSKPQLKPECEKKLDELLKAPPKSQSKKEFNKNLPTASNMSTQSRYNFLQAKPQDEKDKEKKKQVILNII